MRGVESRTSMEKGLQDDRVLADVELERMRRPATQALYNIVWYTIEGKGGSFSRANGMTADIRAKDACEMRHEPGSSGDNTNGSEPKLRMEGEKRMMRRNITMHEKERVKGHTRFCKDNNFIALVKAIGL